MFNTNSLLGPTILLCHKCQTSMDKSFVRRCIFTRKKGSKLINYDSKHNPHLSYKLHDGHSLKCLTKEKQNFWNELARFLNLGHFALNLTLAAIQVPLVLFLVNKLYFKHVCKCLKCSLFIVNKERYCYNVNLFVVEMFKFNSQSTTFTAKHILIFFVFLILFF